MADIQDNSAIIENFGKYLNAHGKRKTPERFKILEKVLEFKKQFTVEDLSKVMLEENFLVSTSTLYNTVDLLVQANILRKSDIKADVASYERVDMVWYIHLKCEECGKIKLVKDTNFMAYMNARKFAAFTTNYYTFTVYGTCNDCARRLKRQRRNNKNK